MKSETDHHKGKGKKHKGITNQASKVPQCGSAGFHVDSRTTNMYSYWINIYCLYKKKFQI